MNSALLFIALVLELTSGPTCVSRGNQLACGFHCTSNLTQLACAQTPEGMCAATPSQVVCWDPPPDVRAIIASGRDDLPQPTCITSVSGAACGYACARTGDKVACANSPMGACATRFGVLRCWDPAPEVRWAMEADGDYRAAACERTLDDVACGYQCQSTLKRIACAQTPWGRCERSGDRLACWDPSLAPPVPSTQDRR